MVYIGTMDGELHGVDADTGKRCAGFGDNGVVNVDQWNTINHKWPVELIQPPAVYKDTLILGWAGLDWVYKIDDPAPSIGIDARTGSMKWTFDPIPAEHAEPDRHRQCVGRHVGGSAKTGLAFLPVSSPSPIIMAATGLKEMPLCHVD